MNVLCQPPYKLLSYPKIYVIMYYLLHNHRKEMKQLIKSRKYVLLAQLISNYVVFNNIIKIQK